MIAKLIAERIDEAHTGQGYAQDLAMLLIGAIADVLPEILQQENDEKRIHEATALSKVSQYLKQKHHLDQPRRQMQQGDVIRDVVQFSDEKDGRHEDPKRG